MRRRPRRLPPLRMLTAVPASASRISTAQVKKNHRVIYHLLIYIFVRSFVRSSLSSRDHPCQERGREEISQGDLLLPLFLLPREDDAWQLERETCKKAKAACSPHEAPSDAAAKTFLQPSPHDCSFVAPPTSFAYSCLSVKA